MKHIPLAIIIFILLGALIIAIWDNHRLTNAVFTLGHELSDARAELEIYHINDAEIQAHDKETWGGDTIYDSTFAQGDSLEGE